MTTDTPTPVSEERLAEIRGKSCRACARVLPLSSFRVEAKGILGRQARCKECHAARDRELYAANLERNRQRNRAWEDLNREKLREKYRAYAKANPDKIRAKHASRGPEPARLRVRSAVQRAIGRGELNRPETCEHCGKRGFNYGHHPDYSRPLDVVWLCAPCHRMEHLRLEGVRP